MDDQQDRSVEDRVEALEGAVAQLTATLTTATQELRAHLATCQSAQRSA